MDPTLFGALAVLALVDSTSFGTLLIPVWLLLAPGRLRTGRILLFLGTVAVFYFAAGLAILFGAGFVMKNFSDLFESRGLSVLLLMVGIALLAWSFRLETQAKREKAERASARHTGGSTAGSSGVSGSTGTAGNPAAGVARVLPAASGQAAPNGRLARWRQKAVGTGAPRGGGAVALIGLALGATTVELATMLPYLGAIGLISTSGMQWPLPGAVLAAYCVLMVAPALVLLSARLFAARRVDPLLRKLDGFLSRTSTNTLSWITGILGVVLIINTARSVLSFGG